MRRGEGGSACSVVSRHLVVLLLLAGSWFLSAPASAVPAFLPFQGRLVDANGAPMTGAYSMTFRIYRTAAATTTPLWTENQSVVVNQGIFSVDLGKVTPLALPFDRQYWVGFQVGGGAEMTPFVRLTTAPYAIVADSGAVFAGPLNVSGAFSADPPLFNVDTANNRVGIGTATPADSLHVVGPMSVNDTMLVEDTVTAGAYLEISTVLYPPGTIFPFGGPTTPDGYLLCDGSSVATASYPRLFAAIGYRYGGGGANFTLPNFRTRIPMGYNAAQSEFNAIGKTGGETVVTLTTANLPSHTHGFSGFTVGMSTDGSHTSPITFGITTAGGILATGYGPGSSEYFPPFTTEGSHSHTVDPAAVTSSSTGSAAPSPHENMMPWLGVNYVIKY